MRCPYCTSTGPFSRLKHEHVVCKKCGYKFNIYMDLELQDPFRKYPKKKGS